MDLQGEIAAAVVTKQPPVFTSEAIHSPAATKVGIRLEPGQRFGFHNFRHSLATFLINKGKDVKTIQGLLRHAKANTTLDLYSQAIDESKLAAQRDIALAITSNQAQAN